MKTNVTTTISEYQQVMVGQSARIVQSEVDTESQTEGSKMAAADVERSRVSCNI
jgi:hypothetical protein